MSSLRSLLFIVGTALTLFMFLFFSNPLAASPTNTAIQASCDDPMRLTQATAADAIATPDDTVIVCDVPITDTIESVGDSDLFSFTAADGDVVHIAVSEGEPSHVFFHAVWRLLKRTGAPVDGSCGEFTHWTVAARDCGPLTATDSPYRIEATDDNNAHTGIYHVHYQLLSGSACRAVGLKCITNSTGEIETPADSDLFTFTITSAGIVKITVAEDSPSQVFFHAVWRLLKSNGTPAESCGEFTHWTISSRDCGPLAVSDSPYRVEVIDDNRTNTGHYTVSLTYLDGSCEEPPATPVITTVRPNQGRNDIANTINIQGAHFAQGAQVSLGSAVLTTTFLVTTQLQAVVPAGVAAGVYDVNVTNPDGGRATLARGYTAFDPVNNDDLFALEYEFYLEPVVPRANAPTDLILRVHRQGGKDPLLNVKVHFYQGDPKAGSLPIGESLLPPLSPRGDEQSPPIRWTPTTSGTHTLYAVIDPDNLVAETYEDNNTVSRVVTVLAAAPDQQAPHVDSFVINGGASSTSVRSVRLDTQASDEPPPGTVAKLLFVEYAYSEAAGLWTPVQQSQWLDYATAHENFAWQLLPPAGVKAIHAWVADAAGNVSRFPFRRQINYTPPSERIEFNQRQIYRYSLTAGQTLAVQLTSLTGDADLYVWPPDYATRPPWVSNLRSAVDDVRISAPISGVYQVEVYGYSAANYQLTDTTNHVVAAQMQGGIDPTKDPPLSDPLLPPTSQPEGRFALVTPGQSQALGSRQLLIFLPTVLRSASSQLDQ